MKNSIIAVIVMAVIGGAVAYRAIAPGNSSTEQSATTLLSATTKIFDVRTAEEYDASHVETASLFPLQTMQTGTFPDVAKDTPIALYCRSGSRAEQALALMKQAGFTNVKNIGGLTTLVKYGLKVN